MLEFTLKFLSGESLKYEVDESTTVRQFKERLSTQLNIPIERQRLIFQGKVLQDDTKLMDSNIHGKTLHFVERAEPIPPPAPTNGAASSASTGSGIRNMDAGLNQAIMDDVNETTSIFINGLPGVSILQPNDIQSLVQNLLNDLGDVGRQAQVNTTMASDGHGVDVNIDFGNINQILEQQEIHERFRSIGRMIARLKLRIDRIQQIVDSNFRQANTPPPPSVPVAPATTVSAAATTTASTEPDRTASPARPVSTNSRASPTPTSTSTTFIGIEDITGTEMDTDSQSATQSPEIMHTPPSTTSTTPIETGSTPTSSDNSVPARPRTARDLVELLTTINNEQQRLQGYFQTYLRTIEHDESFGPELAGRQRFYSLFNEANHLIAHVHHNITDFALDLNDPIATRVLHLGELPISQAGLATVTQAATQRSGSNQEGIGRVPSRTSRTIVRRPTAVATARIMGPIQISSGGSPTLISGDARMPFQYPIGGVQRMVFNTMPRGVAPLRAPAPPVLNNNAAGQSMRFNLGAVPYTFMQMGPDGISLNQVTASVVADIQTDTSSSSTTTTTTTTQSSSTNTSTNQPTGGSSTHVISTGPIQIAGDQLDANIAAEIAQHVTNSFQQHIAQMVNQQMGTTPTLNAQPAVNQNADPSNANRSSTLFATDPASTMRSTESLRSRSADSRLRVSNQSSIVDEDDADWIDLPMNTSDSANNTANTPSTNTTAPMPRLRVPAIIQSIDRSLPCTSPYFTQTLRPPFDNPNNASNITPREAAALNNAAGRTLLLTSASQRPRVRHRHPAGSWAQQQNQTGPVPDFVLSRSGTPAAGNIMAAAGQPFNVTAHSFEIPMVFSTSTTTEIPTASSSSNNAQAGANNDGQQTEMNAVISQVLSQILPGVLRSGNGRVRLNIGQNHSPTNATTTAPSSSQTNPANSTAQSNPIPNMNNIPGVMAGGLDFSNIARSIGSMVQGITGQLLPGATLLNTMSTAAVPPRSSSNTSQTSTTAQVNNSRTSTSNTGSGNNNNTDTVTEHMLTELFRLLRGGLDNPELDNLTIGSFMQRFGEDSESRTNDGSNLVSELFSTMTSSMRFTDVWNLVLGNSVGPRVNEARQAATEYLRTTIIHGRTVTAEVLNEIADKLYESLLREASINFEELRAKPNINLVNVMKRFFHHHLRKLLGILFEGPNTVWFDQFRQQLLTMRNEFLALFSHCLEGGESAAMEFILNRHRIIFRSTNPMIVTWSETYLRTSLTAAFSAVRTSPPHISNYLVEPPPPPPPAVPVRVEQSTPRVPPPTQPAVAFSSIINRTDNEREVAAAAPTSAATTTVPSHETLQSNLPEDWIPIVIRDINTQRDRPNQPPFSDVYREGMPSKRRRVHLREDLTTSNLLQRIVLQASSTNTGSTNSDRVESVLAGEAVPPALVNTFEQELKRLLEQRIRQDRDYPEVQHRMPNTKRYLDGDK